MNQGMLAISILLIGWALGFWSFLQLTNWAGRKVAYWKYFLHVCGQQCMTAMAIALDEVLKESESKNEFRE